MTLRVTLEIVRFGNEEDKHIIETVNISRMRKIVDDECEYVIEHNDYKNYDDTTLRVTHSYSDGALVLVYKALGKLIAESTGT